MNRHGNGRCPFCDHRIALIELERGVDGLEHCNHCRGEVDSEWAKAMQMDSELSDEIQQAYWDAKRTGPLTRCNL